MAAPGPNWGHMHPRAAIVRPPTPSAQPLAVGPDVMGAANSGRAATGRVIRLVAGLLEKLQTRGRAETTNEAEFLEQSMVAPLAMPTHLAPTPLCWTSVPRERWGQKGPSSGYRVSRGDRVARDTAAQGAHRLPHCVFAASAFTPLVSRLSPPPHIPHLASRPYRRQRGLD